MVIPPDMKKAVRSTALNGLNDNQTQVFHAGTKELNGTIRASGGRVLAVTAQGDSASQAQKRAYAAIDKIDWPQGFCRKDIGWRAVQRET